MKILTTKLFLGTLGAIALTYVTYGYFAIQTGFIFKAQASGVAEEYIYHHLGRDTYNETYPGSMVFDALESLGMADLPKLDNCSAAANVERDNLKAWFNDPMMTDNTTQDFYRLWNIGKGCEHGSALDQMTMTYTSFTGYLRYAGGFSASLSSAIASLVGAPRVLQVILKYY